MTDDFSGSSTTTEKLNDSSFHAWKQKIVLILAIKDLDDFIEDGPSTDKSELAKWVKYNRKARAVIGLSLSYEHLEHVHDVQTAREIWQALLNVFERHTLLKKLSARRKFYTVTMENGEKILTYLNRVKQLAATLKSMDVEIDNEELAMAALNWRPPMYENLIVALDALGNDDMSFTFDLVKSGLLQEEQRASEREKSMSDFKSSALVGVSEKACDRFRDNSKVPHKYSNHRCENCGSIGHSVKVCRAKDVYGKRPSNQFPANKPKANNSLVTEHKQSSTQVINQKDFVCLMAKINASAYPKGASSWIVDSGCTAHISFGRSMFNTYEPVPIMNVEMGTKAIAKVSGQGTIILGMQAMWARLHWSKIGWCSTRSVIRIFVTIRVGCRPERFENDVWRWKTHYS